jgi:acyl-CoA reductase-like NAD-dependent aldehyde dehydrogenase
MDIVESGVNRTGMAIKVPVGIIVAIVPSNSPVNLTVNKVGPAIAAGNAVIIKPSDQTPLSALWLAAAFKRAGLPDGAINVVIGEVDEAIGSLRCVGVVIVAKPAGHTIVNQAKDAVKRHGKPHVTIHNSSKNALRNGLIELLLNLHMANADTSAE